MLENNISENDIAKGADIQLLIDQINANEMFGDGVTVKIDKGTSGTTISAVLSEETDISSVSAGFLDPFRISVSKNESDEYVASINTGLITIENPTGSDFVYAIPTEEISINDYSASTTIFVYLKVVSNWGGSNFKGYPTLTVDAVNFAQNNVKQPALDTGHFYYPVGSIVLTVVDDIKSFSIIQSLTTDIFFNTKDMFSFRITQIFSAKANDTASDSAYDVFINGGQALLPDNNVILDTDTTTASISSENYSYLRVSAIPNLNGYWEDWDAVIENSTSVKQSDADNTYYLIGRYGSIFVQSFNGDFISDGRVK